MIVIAVLLTAVAAEIGLWLLAIGVLVCLVRFLHGPSLADRVAALDMIAILLVALFVLYGVAEGQRQLLGVATVLALINFLSTVAFASYIRRKASR